MTESYRLFRRKSGVFYVQKNGTHKQESLRTKNPTEAKRLHRALNEAAIQPAINVQIARAYLNASDPSLVTRTWRTVMEAIVALKKGETLRRWSIAVKDANFAPLQDMALLETRAEHFLKVLADGKVSTNVYLRRIHNFALAMDWLLKPILPRRNWPTVTHGTKTAITREQHQRIVERERNPERRAFYELCWHLGGSQKDVAELTAEDICWEDQTIGYHRSKLKNREGLRVKAAIIHFGQAVTKVLDGLPSEGPLFPSLCLVKSKDRANEFRQRCHGLGIKGLSLHSYRYAWAERARSAGYPERYAQEALGHNSKAVHRAYSKKADVKVPSLDVWEQNHRVSSPDGADAKILRVGFSSASHSFPKSSTSSDQEPTNATPEAT